MLSINLEHGRAFYVLRAKFNPFLSLLVEVGFVLPHTDMYRRLLVRKYSLKSK
jgi:hypothetical protein